MEFVDFRLVATNSREPNSDGQVAFMLNLEGNGRLKKDVPCGYYEDELKHLITQVRLHNTARDALLLGSRLGEILFHKGYGASSSRIPRPRRFNEIGDRFKATLSNVRASNQGAGKIKKMVRIRLVMEGALRDLPWEYLLFNVDLSREDTAAFFLCLDKEVSIIRELRVDQTIVPRSITADEPSSQTMVIAFAGSDMSDPLNLDKERSVIQDLLTKYGSHISHYFVKEVQPATLLGGSERESKFFYVHLFHFSGHAEEPKPIGAGSETAPYYKGGIELVSPTGSRIKMNADKLGNILKSADVSVAVLNGCNTAAQSNLNYWSGTATTMFSVGLSAVVGMQFRVDDDSAIAFTGKFYEALIQGRTIDEAVNRGRMAIDSEQSTQDMCGFGIPVLYLHSEVKDGVVFKPKVDTPTQETSGVERARDDDGVVTGAIPRPAPLSDTLSESLENSLPSDQQNHLDELGDENSSASAPIQGLASTGLDLSKASNPYVVDANTPRVPFSTQDLFVDLSSRKIEKMTIMAFEVGTEGFIQVSGKFEKNKYALGLRLESTGQLTKRWWVPNSGLEVTLSGETLEDKPTLGHDWRFERHDVMHPFGVGPRRAIDLDSKLVQSAWYVWHRTDEGSEERWLVLFGKKILKSAG